MSVVLFERQVQDLDNLATAIRQRGHKAINRASLIRAVLDGVLQSRADLSKHATEATLRDHIVRKMNRRARTL